MSEMEHCRDMPTSCPHCGTNLLPCPFCGGRAVVFGTNLVGCVESECGANIDFGHWCGVNSRGIPAEHYVIEQWNKRTETTKEKRLRTQVAALMNECAAEKEK